MNIAFVNPSLRPGAKRRQLPVGLAYVVSAVKRAGIPFDLVDMDINQYNLNDLREILGKKPYDVVAVGCIVTGYKHVLGIADVAKECNPACVVIAGNSVATSIPEILLNNSRVDIAVMGEGDVTIVELLQALANRRDIAEVKGIIFKKDGRLHATDKRNVIPCLDNVEFPDWEIFDLEKYSAFTQVNVNYFSDKPIVSFPLNSARGCPFNCTFCYHVFKREKYRKYSEDVVMKEIRRLHDRYGCNFINFWDELTFENVASAERMVSKLNNLDFKIFWTGSIRGNLFKSQHLDLVREMKRSGCDNIEYSLENASPEILKAIDKKISVDDFIEQSNVLWKGGVVPLTSVIFGYPQETPESIRLTLEVCEKCNIFPSVGFLLPLPGTPIYQWAKDNGRITDEIEYLMNSGDRQDFHVNLTSMSDHELVDTVTVHLEKLAAKLGLKLDSVFKTTTYQKPKSKDETLG
ncbi:MAG TPA: radical SAM protein [Candidatus Ozemobacteraceae bacterium]|nr:radical SAM protein [Candidatus Ozemobacteraceae bacterium]